MTNQANQRRWNIGCGGAIVVFICFGLFIGISEIRFRIWLSGLDERARSFHGDVYNGRRDSATDVMVSANSSETTDKHMAGLADIVLECLASQDISNLNVNLSGSSITNASLKELSRLNGIDTLDISDTGITEGAVTELSRDLKGTVIKR